MGRAAVAVLRVLVDCGHGLSNHAPNVYDSGAEGCGTTEAELVREIGDQVIDAFYFARDENAGATTAVTVTPTIECNDACVQRHRRSSHLSYKIAYLNDHAAPFDFIVSLHMNSADDPAVSGTEVLYGGNAPVSRLRDADEVSRIVAGKLGLKNRGAKVDTETPRKRIAILRDTDPPALLIELGFITNPNDVKAVRECGAEAVIAAINALVARR